MFTIEFSPTKLMPLNLNRPWCFQSRGRSQCLLRYLKLR